MTEYKYLGRFVTSGNEISKKYLREQHHFLKDRKIPICLKIKIMDAAILPAMTYGAETWALTKHPEKKLAVAQRSKERSLLNITRRDKIRNEIIRSKTGMKEV